MKRYLNSAKWSVRPWIGEQPQYYANGETVEIGAAVLISGREAVLMDACMQIARCDCVECPHGHNKAKCGNSSCVIAMMRVASTALEIANKC